MSRIDVASPLSVSLLEGVHGGLDADGASIEGELSFVDNSATVTDNSISTDGGAGAAPEVSFDSGEPGEPPAATFDERFSAASYGGSDAGVENVVDFENPSGVIDEFGVRGTDNVSLERALGSDELSSMLVGTGEPGSMFTTGTRSGDDGGIRDVQLEVFTNGAIVARDPETGRALDWQAPSHYDEYGALKSVTTAEHDARWWSDYRLSNQLNTVGPNGSEHSAPWTLLGTVPGAQRFGAYHDLQSHSARAQALRDAELSPGAANTSLTGYAWGRGLSTVGGWLVNRALSPEAGASTAKGIYSVLGFRVPDGDGTTLASQWRPYR